MSLEQIYQDKAKYHEQIKELAARQATWTDEDRAAWTKVNADFDSANKLIAEENAKREASEAVQKRLAEVEADIKTARNDKRLGLDEGNRRSHNPEVVVENRDADCALALQGWMRKQNGREVRQEHIDASKRLGINLDGEFGINLRHEFGNDGASLGWTSNGRLQQRAMSVGTGAAGGYTVPEGFMAELERKMLAYGGPRAVARVIRTATGNDVPWPAVDDTGNSGELLAEAGSIGTDSTSASIFSAITLKAYKYSSKPILISSELLNDSAFNLATEVASLLGERLGRITGLHTTTGDNSSKPQGVVTGAAAGVTTASATAIASTELFDLVHSVDPAYRSGNCGWMMHDNILLYVRKLRDGQGQFLFQPGLQAGVPDRLLGYPITINQHMASSVASTNVTMLFGDFSKYVVRDVASLRMFRLEELYRANDQTGFICFSRHDGRILQSAAIKKLTQLT